MSDYKQSSLDSAAPDVVAIKNAIYQEALNYQNAEQYGKALKKFNQIPGWKDADQRKQDCQLSYAYQRDVRAKKTKRGIIAGAAVAVVGLLVFLGITLHNMVGSRNSQEQEQKLLAAKYDMANALEGSVPVQAAIEFGKLGDYSDARERSLKLWDQIFQRHTLAAGNGQTVALSSIQANTTSLKHQTALTLWNDVISVAAGDELIVGLREDHTVVVLGDNTYGSCNVADWTGIVAIAAGANHTVGLKCDGTVVAVGMDNLGQCNVDQWENIVAIAAGDNTTVGLKADGTVVTTGDNLNGQCSVSTWTDIVAIDTGCFHTVGLKADGTVVVAGSTNYNQNDLSQWENIVDISGGSNQCTMGLKADGTVVAIGGNLSTLVNGAGWTDVVAIDTGSNHAVALRKDGTVVATGDNAQNQCAVYDWTNVQVPVQ